ncbi:MAG: flavoprotein [Bdellovibrionota bacterium]|nr:flavoprotein [Bdellovibrionota bacterium]
MSVSKKILFQLTGSIACYKSCDLISKLVQQGHDLKVVASKDALRFVGEATLEGLTGKKVFTDIYEGGKMMAHIHLNEWADLVILHPATANTINAMAAGISTNPISSLFLSFPFTKPYIVFPAMNHKMLSHPATQCSIDNLKEMGIMVTKTGEGNLACGEIGGGRLLETSEALDLLKEYL